MDHDFWHERWQENRIGFHKSEVNPFLPAHIGALGLPAGARIFLPLCGKTRDIGWLLARGFHVAGVELSALAVKQLFADLELVPDVTKDGPLTRYSAEKVDILVGDVFDLAASTLGAVDAIYDRAALIALPAEMRVRYGRHLIRITGRAPQLLITLDYDQSLMDGPPFAISAAELAQIYDAEYRLTELAAEEVQGGLKGKLPAQDRVWRLD